MNKRYSIKNFIMLFIAGAVNAFGITLFLSPVGLFDGGISGTAMVLSSISNLPLWLFLLLLNIPLFFIGLKKQGIAFTIYAIFAVISYSLFVFLINNCGLFDLSFGSPFAKEDILLCSVFGGLISGLGSGLAIRYGGAMDGIEVMAVIFAKQFGITVGTFCLIYNIIIYVIAGILFNSWIIPLYSIIAYYVNLKIVDAIVDGLDRAKGAMIVTEKPEEISNALSIEFGFGPTILEGRGGYSNHNKNIVYFVVNRFQVTKMKDIVHNVDPFAYITLSDIADIFKSNVD